MPQVTTEEQLVFALTRPVPSDFRLPSEIEAPPEERPARYWGQTIASPFVGMYNLGVGAASFGYDTIANLPETAMSLSAMTWPGGFAANVMRARFAEDLRRDPDFNPGQFILDTGMYKDPRVVAMADMNQFDHSVNEELFWMDYNMGIQFFQDAERLQASDWGSFMASMGALMIGDPTNFLIPASAGPRLAAFIHRATKLNQTAAYIVSTGSIAGGLNVAIEKMDNLAVPMTDMPGLTNEAIVGIAGFALGGTLGTIISPTGPVQRMYQSRTISRQVERMQKYTEEHGGKVIMRLTDEQGQYIPGSRITLDDAIAQTQNKVTTEIDAAMARQTARKAPLAAGAEQATPTPQRVAITGYVGNPDTDPQVARLRELLAEEGTQLDIAFHPDIDRYRIVHEEIPQILNQAMEMVQDATSSDLNLGRMSRAANAIVGTFGETMSQVTPTGRLAGTGLYDFNAALRTLVGEATITTAAARNPITAPVGANAEGIAITLRAMADNVTVEQQRIARTALREAKKSGKPVHMDDRVIRNQEDFNQSVTDYITQANDAAHGYVDAPTSNVHPSIVEAANLNRDYFRRMHRELERAGMLPGPEAVAQSRERLAAARQNAETARAMADNEMPSTPLVGPDGQFSFSKARINQTLSEMVEGYDNLAMARDMMDSYEATMGGVGQDGDFALMDGLIIHPEDLKTFSFGEQQNIRRHFKVSEDYASDVRDFIGHDTYDAAVREAAGIDKPTDRIPGMVESMMDPERLGTGLADPDLELAAALYHIDRHNPVEGARRYHVIDPGLLPEGTKFRMFGQQFEISADPDTGTRYIVGDDFTLSSEVSAIPVDRGSLASETLASAGIITPDMKARVDKLRRTADAADRQVAKLESDIRTLEDTVAGMENYLPHVWQIENIKADPFGFDQGLIDSWTERDLLVNGRRIEPSQRRVRPEAMDDGKMDEQRIIRRAKAKVRATEGSAALHDPEAPAQPPFRLPEDLQGANPHFGYGRRNHALQFESDLDRALYIVAQDQRSPADGRFMQALRDYTGLQDLQIRRMGKRVRQQIKAQAATARKDDVLRIKARTATAPTRADMTLQDAARVLTVGDLPRSMRAQYEQNLRLYYQRAARAAREHLTDPNNIHGVTDALPNNPLKRRLMDISETRMRKFLEGDITHVRSRYSAMTAGNAAVRLAIADNPHIWGHRRLPNGEPIRTGQDIIDLLRHDVDVLRRFGEMSGNQKIIDTANRLQGRVDKTLLIPLSEMLGTPIKRFEGTTGWLSSVLSKYVYTVLGGVFQLAQVPDTAAMSMMAALGPRGTRALGRIARVKTGKDGVTKRELQIMGVALEGKHGRTRAEALADIQDATQRGIGSSRITRAITGGISDAANFAHQNMARISMLNFTNRQFKKMAALMVADKMTDYSKRLLRAHKLMDTGLTEAQALRKAGLSQYEAARLNHLGLNAETAQRFHELNYRHGTLVSSPETPVSSRMTFDEYMRSNEAIINNFADWDLRTQSDRQLYDRLLSSINSEVHRHLVVTPGAFDRPLINRTALGNLVNQFQSFGMAFTNHRIRPMAQMPAHYQLWYYAIYAGLGALQASIMNQLSGRRSFDETAQLWAENPLAAMYEAVDRSGLLTWAGRPLALADLAGFPLGPRNLLGEPELGASTNRYFGRDEVLDIRNLGAAGGVVQRAGQVSGDLLRGDPNQMTLYRALKLAPWQNLVWLRLAHQTTGLPTVPEAFHPHRD